MTLRQFPPPAPDECLRHEWQLTFDLSSYGIAVLDARTGVMERVNPAFARMHGGLPEHFAGRPIGTTLTPEWEARVPEIVRSIHERGSRSIECDRVRRDGSIFRTTTEIVAARGPDGQLLYRLVFVTDLTDIHARDVAGRRAVERFEHVFQQAPVGLVLVRGGLIERVNAAAEDILGASAEDVLGIDHRIVSHLVNAPLSGAALAAFQADPVLPPQDRRVTQRDGTISVIRYSYSILDEAPGCADPVVLVLLEDRSAEAEARAREEQLKIVEEREQIAHDLHDNAIQHLFAIGMTVQSIAAAVQDTRHAQRLEQLLQDIDQTIRGIRGVIHALKPSAVSF